MKKIIKKIITLFIFVLVIVVGYIVLDGYYLYKTTITKEPIKQKIEEIEQSGNYIDKTLVPEKFFDAVVSIEDKRFYKHSGFDVVSMIRATVTNLKEGKIAEGGSTITQQLVKNMYFTNEKRFTRKVAEILIAYDLEKEISKKDILNLYSNIVYFGDGYYGIYDASVGYFNKLPEKLTLNEITILAGLPNAPSAYALSSNKDLAKKRQKKVIEAMMENGYITVEEFNSLK